MRLKGIAMFHDRRSTGALVRAKVMTLLACIEPSSLIYCLSSVLLTT